MYAVAYFFILADEKRFIHLNRPIKKKYLSSICHNKQTLHLNINYNKTHVMEAFFEFL